MYAIYGNIYHQYTPNVSIYTIHGSYGNRNILNKKHTSNMVHPLTLCQANVEDLKAQLRTLRLELGEADRPFWIAWGRDSKMGWEYIEDMWYLYLYIHNVFIHMCIYMCVCVFVSSFMEHTMSTYIYIIEIRLRLMFIVCTVPYSQNVWKAATAMRSCYTYTKNSVFCWVWQVGLLVPGRY